MNEDDDLGKLVDFLIQLESFDKLTLISITNGKMKTNI